MLSARKAKALTRNSAAGPSAVTLLSPQRLAWTFIGESSFANQHGDFLNFDDYGPREQRKIGPGEGQRGTANPMRALMAPRSLPR